VSTQASPPDVQQRVDDIVACYPRRESSLVQVLQDVNREFNYLPAPALERVAAKLRVRLAKVYGVATFYKAFSLEPRGRNSVKVCTGTACHVRGAAGLRDEVERLLQIPAGTTTEDLKFTVETVNCVGACGMAPVVIVNEKYHRNVKVDQVKTLLESCE